MLKVVLVAMCLTPVACAELGDVSPYTILNDWKHLAVVDCRTGCRLVHNGGGTGAELHWTIQRIGNGKYFITGLYGNRLKLVPDTRTVWTWFYWVTQFSGTGTATLCSNDCTNDWTEQWTLQGYSAPVSVYAMSVSDGLSNFFLHDNLRANMYAPVYWQIKSDRAPSPPPSPPRLIMLMR